MITHVDTVKNNVDDAKVLENNLPELHDEMGIEVMVTDGGYVSDSVRELCDGMNIDFVATAIPGKEQAEDALTSIDFPLNENGLISACPGGHAPVKRSMKKDGNIKATFSMKQCTGCNLKDRCMAYRKDANGSLTVDIHRRWLDERRVRMGLKSYRGLCVLRPPVEGLMEKLKPKYLTGRILFRGLVRVRSRMVLRAIGVNFRRYYLRMLLFFRFLVFGEMKMKKLGQVCSD